MDLIYHARSDCINWWVNHVKLFPNLEPIARMARQYHSVSAVSVTVWSVSSRLSALRSPTGESEHAPRR